MYFSDDELEAAYQASVGGRASVNEGGEKRACSAVTMSRRRRTKQVWGDGISKHTAQTQCCLYCCPVMLDICLLHLGTVHHAFPFLLWSLSLQRPLMLPLCLLCCVPLPLPSLHPLTLFLCFFMPPCPSPACIH